MTTAAAPTPDFNISARRLFAAMRIAESHDSIREYLTGVLIEPIEVGGVWIVATDGTCMLVQRDRDGFAPFPAILRVTEPAAEPSIYDEDERPLGWLDTRITIPHSVMESPQVGLAFFTGFSALSYLMLCETVGDAQQFPPWRKVLSSAKPFQKPTLPVIDDARFVGWGPRYLQLLSQDRDTMQIRQCAPASIGVITFHEDPDAIAILTPKPVGINDDSGLANLLTDIGATQLRDDLGLAAPTTAAEGT